jgi:L-malate glycosyltransferase
MARQESDREVPRDKGLRLLVTVTFSHNQLRSHLEPILALPEVEAVTLVADRTAPLLPKLRTVVPPRLLRRVLGRAGAKLVVSLLIARRERPDWVIAYSLVPHGLTAAAVGRLTGRRVIYHMIGGPKEWEGGGWRSANRIVSRLPRPVPALEALLIRVIRASTVVVAMGEQGRRALLARGVDPDRVVVIPPSVDERRFHPSKAEGAQYQLVTVGELVPSKAMHDFLHAVARLRRDWPGLRAAIAGKGPLEAALRAEAEKLGVSDSVDFLGFREDIDTVYACSQIFVLPSRYEGLSVAVIEAMASGLPAVVTDVGELRDLVRDGRNGYVVPVGDLDALTERLALLLDSPEARRRLGEAAALDARALSGVAQIGESYRRILEA